MAAAMKICFSPFIFKASLIYIGEENLRQNPSTRFWRFFCEGDEKHTIEKKEFTSSDSLIT